MLKAIHSSLHSSQDRVIPSGLQTPKIYPNVFLQSTNNAQHELSSVSDPVTPNIAAIPQNTHIFWELADL